MQAAAGIAVTQAQVPGCQGAMGEPVREKANGERCRKQEYLTGLDAVGVAHFM
jgi:hypothetical protein